MDIFFRKHTNRLCLMRLILSVDKEGEEEECTKVEAGKESAREISLEATTDRFDLFSLCNEQEEEERRDWVRKREWPSSLPLTLLVASCSMKSKLPRETGKVLLLLTWCSDSLSFCASARAIASAVVAVVAGGEGGEERPPPTAGAVIVARLEWQYSEERLPRGDEEAREQGKEEGRVEEEGRGTEGTLSCRVWFNADKRNSSTLSLVAYLSGATQREISKKGKKKNERKKEQTSGEIIPQRRKPNKNKPPERKPAEKQATCPA